MSEVAHAVRRLREGGVVAFPTETVYGLGADALSEAAVRRVFELKGRPAINPLIVHVHDAAGAARCVSGWTREAEALALAFWPGPLSIVLPRAGEIPSNVTAGGPNVAVRCPDHPLTLALLRAFGGPIVGPSANRSGRVSPTTAAHVREVFDEREVMVLDGGACRGGIESTVLSLVGGEVEILRPGLVDAGSIARVLGREVRHAPGHDGGGAPRAPGRLASHYAPRSRLVLTDAGGVARALAGAAGGCVVLGPEGLGVPEPHVAMVMPGSARAYASRLYAALHEADARGPRAIVVVRPEAVGDEAALWRAVLDRLERAGA